MNACYTLQANVINGITAQENIADYWKEHFYKILNANDCDHHSNMAVSVKSITEIVSKLEYGKSAWPDGISDECFKFLNTKMHVLLS